jgi:hypothetical protein
MKHTEVYTVAMGSNEVSLIRFYDCVGCLVVDSSRFLAARQWVLTGCQIVMPLS